MWMKHFKTYCKYSNVKINEEKARGSHKKLWPCWRLQKSTWKVNSASGWLAASAVTRLNLSYPWINHLQQERFIGADFMQYCLKAQELNASRNYWNQQIKTKQDNSSKTYLMWLCRIQAKIWDNATSALSGWGPFFFFSRILNLANCKYLLASILVMVQPTLVQVEMCLSAVFRLRGKRASSGSWWWNMLL